MAALFLVLATINAAIAVESAAAADPVAPTALPPASNERAGLDKATQTGRSDRDREDGKQALAARLADVKRDIEAAKKGALITDFLRRMPDGSVMLNDGRQVTVLTERRGTELRLSFCDQQHKESYIRQRAAEVETLTAGIARLEAEKKAPAAAPLDLAKIAVGDVGALGGGGETVAEVIKVIDGTDVLVSLPTKDRKTVTLWISDYPTGGVKAKATIKLSGPFIVVGSHENPLLSPTRIFELRPLNRARSNQPQVR